MGKRTKRSMGGLASFVKKFESPAETLAAKKEALLHEFDLPSSSSTPPPSKKQKIASDSRTGAEKYDASSLVPRFLSEDDVPGHLKKCTFVSRIYLIFPPDVMTA